MQPLVQPAASSTAPVRDIDGMPAINSTDVSSNGFGSVWGLTRSWTGLNNASLVGNGWSILGIPYVVVGGGTNGASTVGGTIPSGTMSGTEADNRISIVDGGVTAFTFTVPNTSPYDYPVAPATTYSYTPWNAYNIALQLVTGTPNLLRFTDAEGNVTEFYDVARDSTTHRAIPYSRFTGSTLNNYGLFKDWISANGSTTITANYDANNYLQTLTRTDSATGASDRMVFSYATVTNSEVTANGGTPATLISSVVVQNLVSGSWENAEQSLYTYYTGETSPGVNDPNGRLGDLKLVTIQNYSAASSSWVTVSTDYYRYYKLTGESYGQGSQGPTNTQYTQGPSAYWPANSSASNYSPALDALVMTGLKTVVEGASFARMASAVSNYESAADSTINAYADHYFQYERWADHVGADGYVSDGAESYNGDNGFPFRTGYRLGTRYRVSLEIANGAGCSCTSGQGTFKYEYGINYDTSTADGLTNGGFGFNLLDYNVWRYRTTEFLPNVSTDWALHDRNVVYSNEVGQPLLSLQVHVASTDFSITGMSVSGTQNSDGSYTVTVTTSADHGYSVGNVIALTGVAPELYDGIYTITAVPASNQFQFNLPYTYVGSFGPPTPQINAAVHGTSQSASVTQVLNQWATAYRYDATTGLLLQAAQPSAVLGYDDRLGDPTDQKNGSSVVTDGWLAANTGEIDAYIYGSTTSAGVSTPGDVKNYLKEMELKHGTSAAADPQYSIQYLSHSDSNGITVFVPGTYEVYQNTGGGGGETTTYAYAWFSGTNQVESVTATLPVIPSAQNGPNVADTQATAYDIFGNATWTKDGDGHVNYTGYDPATGGITEQITDVDYTKLSTTQKSSFDVTGWTQPTGGLHLDTTYQLDNIGRQTEEADPNLNKTYTVYLDASHETRVYPGFDGTTTTGPVQITRDYWPAAGSGYLFYHESLTSSLAPHLTGGVPDGLETPAAGDIKSLTRSFTNDAGQVVWTDTFSDLTGQTYTQAVSLVSGAPQDIGTSGMNFYRTIYGYTDLGRVDRVVSPTGTIHRTVYDIWGRILSQWVGTNDTPASGWWSPQNNTAPSNMMKVSDNTYNDETAALPQAPIYPDVTDYGAQPYIHLSAGWYWVKITYVTPNGESAFSPEVGYYVGDNDALVVHSPTSVPGAIGWNVYVSNSAGAETLQNVSPIAFGNPWTEDFNNGITTTGRTAPLADTPTSGAENAATLAQTTAYPGGSQAARVTQFLDDWRNRQVAQKDGVQASENDGTHRPILYTTWDNLSEPTGVYRFDGDGIDLSDFASTALAAVAPTADLGSLRAKSITSYDDQGRVYRQQTYSVDQGTGAVGPSLTTDTFYDHRGNVVAVFNPGGVTTKSVFDGAGRLVTQYTTDGGATNDAGSPLNDWTHAIVVTSDVVLSESDYTLDADGNIILTATRERFHNDAQTAMGALGSPTTGIGARVYYMANYYDAANRLTDQVNVGTNGGSAYTRPGSVPSRSDLVLVTHTDYDVAGNAYQITDPRGVITQYTFDLLGRKTQELDGASGSPANASNLTLWSYDGDNNVLTMTAAPPNGSGSHDQITAYVHGVGGTIGANLFSNDLIATVEYPDPNTGAASGSANNQVGYSYDLLGEVMTKTDQNQSVHSESYDILGRLKLDAVTTLAAGVDGSVRALGYAYTALGLPYQQTSYSDSGGTTVVNQVQESYNGYGQLTAQYQAHSGTVDVNTTPSTQYTFSQPTGANYSRMTQMVYPNGRALSYGYGAGLDSAVSRVTALDDYNDTSGHHVAIYSYLGLGTIVTQAYTVVNGLPELTYVKLSGEANGDAGDQYTGLDRFGRVVDQRWIEIKGGSPPIIVTTDRFKYGYDRDGNVLFKNNVVNGSFSELYHANSSSSADNNKAYDNLNRITDFRRGTLSASANNGGVLDTVSTLNTLANSSQSWSLDNIGNWNSLTTDGTLQSNTFDDQNKQTHAGSNTLGFDYNGNTTTDDQGHTLAYDAWNRMVAVKNGSTTLASYGFDAGGNRIIQTENSATTDLYFTAAGQVIEERQGATVTAQYVWGLMYVNDLILRDDNSTSGNLGKSGSGLGRRLYVQQDANWNVTGVAGSNGGVGERFVYTPYGVRTILSSTWASASDAYALAYSFQGMRLDSATGVLHEGSRDDLPSIGRWAQRDGAYVDGANLYQFVGSNPTGYVDPDGQRREHGAAGGGYPGPESPPQPPPPPPQSVLANQLLNLLGPDERECTNCAKQAKDLADALQSVVDNEPWQFGGNFGNLCNALSTLNWGNQCLDWQTKMRDAISRVQNNYHGKMCFDFKAISGTHPSPVPSWIPKAGDPYFHAWIVVSGPNGALTIDPWPSGGDKVIDNSKAPDFTPLPGGTSNVGEGRAKNPCCKK